MNRKILNFIANQAKRAFVDSNGLASRGYGYEPGCSNDETSYRTTHTSKIESLFNKIVRQ